MSAINRPGTVIQLTDGRIATTCYNHLDGVGVVWGKRVVTYDDPPPYDELLRDIHMEYEIINTLNQEE